MPESAITTIVTPIKNKTLPVFSKLILSGTLAMFLRYGNAILAITSANITAQTTMIVVSPITCTINCFLLLPNTLRIPTSFERPTDCAVYKLIKFIDAMMIISIAIKDSVLRVATLVM